MSRTKHKAFIETPSGLTITVLRQDYRNYSPRQGRYRRHEAKVALRHADELAIAEQLAEIAEDHIETERMAIEEALRAEEDAFYQALEDMNCGDRYCPFCHPHTDNCRICG